MTAVGDISPGTLRTDIPPPSPVRPKSTTPNPTAEQRHRSATPVLPPALVAGQRDASAAAPVSVSVVIPHRTDMPPLPPSPTPIRYQHHQRPVKAESPLPPKSPVRQPKNKGRALDLPTAPAVESNGTTTGLARSFHCVRRLRAAVEEDGGWARTARVVWCGVVW